MGNNNQRGPIRDSSTIERLRITLTDARSETSLLLRMGGACQDGQRLTTARRAIGPVPFEHQTGSEGYRPGLLPRPKSASAEFRAERTAQLIRPVFFGDTRQIQATLGQRGAKEGVNGHGVPPRADVNRRCVRPGYRYTS